MEGDLRSLYIVWLAAQHMMGSYDEEEEYEIDVPVVPPAFGTLTAAQQELAELLQVPEELLGAASRHSNAAHPARSVDMKRAIKQQRREKRYRLLLSSLLLVMNYSYEIAQKSHDCCAVCATWECIS